MALLTVSLVKISPDGSQTTYTGITALRRETSAEAVDGGLYFQPDTARIHIQASDLADGVKPDREDRIVDSVNSEVWVIKRVSWDTLRTRWKCFCQLLINTTS